MNIRNAANQSSSINEWLTNDHFDRFKITTTNLRVSTVSLLHSFKPKEFTSKNNDENQHRVALFSVADYRRRNENLVSNLSQLVTNKSDFVSH